MKRVWPVFTLSLVLFGCDTHPPGIVEPPDPVQYMGVMPINDEFTLENWEVIRVNFHRAGIDAQTKVWNQWWMIYIYHPETKICATAYLQTFGAPTEPQPAGLTVSKLFPDDDLRLVMVEWIGTEKRGAIFSVPPPTPINCDNIPKPQDAPPSPTGHATVSVAVAEQ